MEINDDYIFHSLLSTQKIFKKIEKYYFTDSNIYELLKNINIVLSDFLQNYNAYSHSDVMDIVNTLNEIEEYIVNSVPKKYPNELKILLNYIWKNTVELSDLNILITQKPNLSYHHMKVDIVKDNYVFFCIPKHYKNEILLNSIVLHELGHYYDKKDNTTPIIRSEIIPLELTLEAKKQQIDPISWYRELFADLFSVKTGSFSCFFSLYETIINHDFVINQITGSDSHPYSIYRFILIKNYLIQKHKAFFNKSKYGKKINTLITDCEKKYENILLLDNTKIEKLYGYYLYEHFLAIEKGLFESIKEIELNNAIDSYIDQIIHLIPPKIVKNDTLISLVISGWLAYYFERDKIAERANIDKNDLENIRKIVNNLIRKSIRNADAYSLWVIK